MSGYSSLIVLVITKIDVMFQIVIGLYATLEIYVDINITTLLMFLTIFF